MKRTSLLFAVAVVVLANAFALTHAWLNRVGSPDGIITLTQGDLVPWQTREIDSGLDVHLNWNGWEPETDPPSWAKRRNMEQLGFDYSVPPDSPDSAAFYRRQPPRRAFAALEIMPGRNPAARVIDVNPDDSTLRNRYPDTSHIIVVPAVVSIQLRPGASAKIAPRITELPTHIHIPKPFSSDLRERKSVDGKVPFRLQIRYGRLHEPWVTGLDFPAAH